MDQLLAEPKSALGRRNRGGAQQSVRAVAFDANNADNGIALERDGVPLAELFIQPVDRQGRRDKQGADASEIARIGGADCGPG